LTTAVAVAEVSCTLARSEELFSQYGALASQNSTRPEFTGEPPDVTFAVKVIGVLYGTFVEEIVNTVVVDDAA
jgi:hypothetical protein